MSFTDYLRRGIWDLLLCTSAAAALVYTAFSGFFATQPLQQHLGVVALVCLALVCVLYCIAFSARSAVLGGVAYAVLSFVVVGACAAVGPAQLPFDDIEGNLAIGAAIALFLSAMVFVLSRRQSTCLALLVAGVLLCALVEYLYWYAHVIAFLVFVVAAFALLVYKSYQRNLADSESEQLAFGAVTATAAGFALVALACACAISLLVLQPLELPRNEVKLLTEYKSVEEIEVVGTGAALPTLGSEQSNNSNGQLDEGNLEDVTTGTTTPKTLGEMLGLSDGTSGDSGHALSLLDADYRIVVAVLLVVLAVAGSIAGKRLLRRRAFGRMVAGGGASAAQNLYRFFVDRLARVGLSCPVGLSLCEFAQNYNASFSQFETGVGEGKSMFSVLTDIYSRAVYGAGEISERELVAFTGYYRAFYRRMRKFAGPLRYARLFFTV